MLISPFFLTIISGVLYCICIRYLDCDDDEKYGFKVILTVALVTIWITYFTTMAVDIIGTNCGWWDNIVVI